MLAPLNGMFMALSESDDPNAVWMGGWMGGWIKGWMMEG